MRRCGGPVSTTPAPRTCLYHPLQDIRPPSAVFRRAA